MQHLQTLRVLPLCFHDAGLLQLRSFPSSSAAEINSATIASEDLVSDFPLERTQHVSLAEFPCLLKSRHYGNSPIISLSDTGLSLQKVVQYGIQPLFHQGYNENGRRGWKLFFAPLSNWSKSWLDDRDQWMLQGGLR